MLLLLPVLSCGACEGVPGCTWGWAGESWCFPAQCIGQQHLGCQNEVQPLRLGVHTTAQCWHHQVTGVEISAEMGLWCQHHLID